MLPLLRGAVYVQLAAHFQLPADIQARTAHLARDRMPDRIVSYLQDETISRKRDAQEVRKIRQALDSIKTVNKDVKGNEDTGTLIANYENVTGTPFPKPAWMSLEMNKIDLLEEP